MKLANAVDGADVVLAVGRGNEVIFVAEAAAALKACGVATSTVPTSVEDCVADEAAGDALAELLELVHRQGAAMHRLWRAESDVTFVAPVRRPGQILCVGLNYRDHAAEVGLDAPDRPLYFAKLPSAVTGPGGEIEFPAESIQLDYEAELAVVIGATAHRVTANEARAHIAGYTIFNDVSVRDVMFADGQWTRGKSGNTHAPMGPYLVTRAAIADPQSLAVRTTVNGAVRQESTTAEMIVGVDALVADASQWFTLRPGDVIATGTPAGVGLARQPPAYLEPGDVVSVSIDGLGTLTNTVGPRHSHATPAASNMDVS
ncbi:fumarylacetoacetate hydrolase family protein [Microbacterium sp. NPDC055910]|uniref:fumarylacetoacetate hydrolase family protein n=1 Tax=Microbacterium sp. NPDC055910 TaxID=3345659 RepID=UPI0035D7C3F0